MKKIELVTREVLRIVFENCTDREFTTVWADEKLNTIEFNVTSGRHEIECFFGIDFEQEQVDAWETVQNIIDDVMNLWISPITDAADPVAVERLKKQQHENEQTFTQNVEKIAMGKKYGVVGHVGPEITNRIVDVGAKADGKSAGVFLDVPEIGTPYVIVDGTLLLYDAFMTQPGRLDPPTEADRAAHMLAADINPINRIERADVESFRNDFQEDKMLAYQRIATKSAIYPGKGTPFGLMYAALGLAEAGEVQNKVKKAFRDDGVIRFGVDNPRDEYGPRTIDVECFAITPERRAQIIKELGGVLWYIAAVCDEINATMSEVALTNLDELCGRGERNTLRGDGDNR